MFEMQIIVFTALTHRLKSFALRYAMRGGTGGGSARTISLTPEKGYARLFARSGEPDAPSKGE